MTGEEAMRAVARAENRRVRLIVNADDFGMARPITDAIIDCHRRGIVTSTSWMANMPEAEHAARRVREVPGLGVGVHLNLTQGRPLSQPERIPLLVGTDGDFLPKATQAKRLRADGPIAEQVRSELAAQIRHALALGIRPTHCDSHHGLHRLPLVRRAMVDVLQSFGIRCARTQVEWHRPMRRAPLGALLRCAARNLSLLLPAIGHYRGRFLIRRAGIRTPDRKLTRGMIYPRLEDPKLQLLACLDNLPRGVSELILHPGYAAEMIGSPDFAPIRALETRLAMDQDVLAAVDRLGIRLVSYGHL